MTDTSAEREAESAWVSLRRRKVVQWGLVYVAAAWGFLQGLEYVGESFNWPQQVRQIAVLVLVIGLPIVLVLAWYHGDRGQQRISTPEFAILTLLLLLGGGVFWYYQRTSEAGKDAAATASAVQPDTSPGVADARPSVAVLPFENRSREADDAYFVDGIHDDILTQLSKIGALRVISRTSVEQFRDTKLSMKAIGDQLGVTKILEGGVQRAGERVRVTVQLIDASNDAHLWAESYDRELSAANIFAIQSEVAGAIAGALKAALTPQEQASIEAIPTRNLEAWQAYQLGRQRLARRTSSSLKDAEEFFRKAVSLDPEFALAYAGLSNAIDHQIQYAGRSKDAALDEAQKAADRALALDSNSAEAWSAAGLVALDRDEYGRAEGLLRRANTLNPNYAQALQWLSYSITGPSRWDEAVEIAERAAVLDPLSAITIAWLGTARANAGDFDGALVALKRAATIDPEFAAAYGGIGAVHSDGLGRLGAAVPWYEKAFALDSGNPTIAISLALTHWNLGNRSDAERWLRQALATGDEVAEIHALAALVYRDFGDATAARQHAQRAAALNVGILVLLQERDLLKHDYATTRGRYEKAYPQLSSDKPTKLTYEWDVAVELAYVLQHTGEAERAGDLLDLATAACASSPRLGWAGYGILDVQIAALRGDKVTALTKLREAEQARWRSLWRYYRNFDPTLASIRNEPEFKAVFADIERDMAQQRAHLAARPKDAPLELTDASR